MDKALKMGQTSATGSLQLFIGKILNTLILAVGTVILGYLFVQEGDYGLYTIALVPATTVLLFQDWGVSQALTRYCAQFRAAKEESKLREIIVAGLTFQVVTGLILTVVLLIMASFIGSTVFGKPQSSFLISISSITILTTAIYTGTSSIFVGFERMKLTSLTIICQAIVQSTIAPLLVFLGFGALGALIGYTTATIAASIVSVALLYFSIFRKLPRSKNLNFEILTSLRPLLKYGVPLAIAAILGGMLAQFYSFLTARYVSDALIGNFRIATNFGLLLTFLIYPITTVLFPAFSKLDPKNEAPLLKTVFALSVKYTTFLLIPSVLATIVLSAPLVGTIYGDRWAAAPFFLALYASVNLLTLFGSISLISFFSAMGETKLLMKLNLLTLIVGIPLGILLIPITGIVGNIIGYIISSIPSVFIGLYLIHRRYGLNIDFKASASIFLAATVAATSAYLFLIFLDITNWAKLLIGFSVYLTVYLVAAPFSRAINHGDIENFRGMFSELGPISKLVDIPLKIIEKFLPNHD